MTREEAERIVARVAYAERDAAHAALTAAGVDDGHEDGDPPTGYSLPTRIGLLVEERDELRLVLLAEQGDAAGAPSEGWTAFAATTGGGSWRGVVWDHPARGRVARAATGQGWIWTGFQPGQMVEVPTAREAMAQADKAAAAAEGGEG